MNPKEMKPLKLHWGRIGDETFLTGDKECSSLLNLQDYLTGQGMGKAGPSTQLWLWTQRTKQNT